ncbi:hypothetical protein PIB30_073693 [Stylosanthes scabra]|uniref:Uncharacterized protein n=1 Tax=Stylosanthes scabra TaxID=79078 RepID=A0ABU6VRB6_9FABA|nr:hypothetical protein [Stylosanthes scabra]
MRNSSKCNESIQAVYESMQNWTETNNISYESILAPWGVDSFNLASFSNFSDYLESILKLPRIDSYVHRVDFKSFMRVRVDSDTLRIDSYTSRSCKLSVWLHGIDSPYPGIDLGP